MKIRWQQLLVVALVAAVVGGAAGYLGGSFDNRRVSEGNHVGTDSPTVSRPLVPLGVGSLEERIEVLEREIGGGFVSYGDSIQARLSQLEQQVGSQLGRASYSSLESSVGSLERRVSQLESDSGGGLFGR